MSSNVSQILPLKFYPKPYKQYMHGSYCILQPFDKAAHSSALYNAFLLDKEGKDWAYLPHGPFHSETEFYRWVDLNCLKEDPLFFTVCTSDLNPCGIFSFLKIEPIHGKLELAHVHFSPIIQQSAASTEALYLAMKFIFEDLGYRRLEWKCDNANERSKRCAVRLGFVFEGVFRQHWIIKSRNRDTAWYSIIDKEWPVVKDRLERWLSPNNFNSNGEQINKLADL